MRMRMTKLKTEEEVSGVIASQPGIDLGVLSNAHNRRDI